MPDSQATSPMFKSCIELSTLVLERPDIFPIDYLDDLEALYYSICWLCVAYIAPGSWRPKETLSKPIWDWVHYPLSKEVAQWKEHQLLYGPGIENEQIAFYFGTPFEVMLRRMREVLRNKYWRKVALGRGRTAREMIMEATRDFDEFNGIVQRAIREAGTFYWERNRAGGDMWFGDGLDEVFFDPTSPEDDL
ncbi:hypothetical protein GALMADRAFT_382414 [Galerina marginata CBS 339.88]|uniref:Fungal-type protein kinase domain-containing protein n=1 Tax=Galerina marginata (strain CBS 339.88) TaxID=685588 RepID=A0A067U2U0_GALM3|nr:hypothetical protein GALMADRAFT_382414 [Galerina marginata CBS 339.88]